MRSLFSRYKGHAWWSSAIGPRQLKPKSTGDACSLSPSRMPRSDNVVVQLRCGPAWSVQVAVWPRLAAARGILNAFHQAFKRGGGDGDHPSFLTQALHPQLNNNARATHPSKLIPSRAHLSRPNLSCRHVGLALRSHN